MTSKLFERTKAAGASRLILLHSVSTVEHAQSVSSKNGGDRRFNGCFGRLPSVIVSISHSLYRTDFHLDGTGLSTNLVQ